MPDPSTTTGPLVFQLSGGVTNTDPSSSIGGPASANPVLPDTLNALFDDVTGTEVLAGQIDYRCIYVFNDGAPALADVTCWIDYEYPDGADTAIGVPVVNEVQVVSFTGDPTGGTFTLAIDDQATDAITWNPSNLVTAGSIQTALNDIENGEGAVVTVGDTANSFVVTFEGVNRHRRVPTMSTDGSGLLYTGDPPEISVAETTLGYPINAVASLSDSTVTTPVGVTFSVPTLDSPADIGWLRSGEGFPVWVRRTALSEAEPTAEDGVVLKVAGDIIAE